MKNKAIIKCQNCGGTNFKPTSIGTILATEGEFSVNAYACQRCGHIELFEPRLDMVAKQICEERKAQRQQAELERKKVEEIRQQKIKKLNEIINNEDSTVRQVKEAKKELERIKNNRNLNNETPFFEDRS